MTFPISWRYAYRNLSRNYRRTFLSAMGVAIGCSIAIINIGFIRGKQELFIRSSAEGGSGHLRIAPMGWFESHDPKLRLKDGLAELGNVRALPEVKAAVPRTRIQTLIAMGTRMVGTEMIGVEPSVEPLVFRFVRNVSQGRYLTATDQNSLVIGQAIADRLRIGVDDEVVVTMVDDAGTMKSEMFRIVGIVSTGSRQFDLSVCQSRLEDIQRLSGKPGLGEITLLLKDPSDTPRIQRQVAAILPPDNKIYSWQEMNPQVQVAVRINAATAYLITGILLLVAFFGVASAQLTAVLERRREIGILNAIGMPTREILKLVLSESAVLAAFSALATIMMCVPLLYWAAKTGISVVDPKQGFNVMGMMIDPILRADFGLWIVEYAVLLSLLTTTLASLYPAWFAARLEPAVALRVAQ